MLGPTAHIDTFARDHLPPEAEWPEFKLDGFAYPDRLNAAVELTDKMVARGFGDHTALIGNGRRRTYKELTDWSNRLAHALVEDYGVIPGARVLIRSANNPAMVACWLAATKAGAVVVNSMPMLRAATVASHGAGGWREARVRRRGRQRAAPHSWGGPAPGARRLRAATQGRAPLMARDDEARRGSCTARGRAGQRKDADGTRMLRAATARGATQGRAALMAREEGGRRAFGGAAENLQPPQEWGGPAPGAEQRKSARASHGADGNLQPLIPRDHGEARATARRAAGRDSEKTAARFQVRAPRP